jgi:A/G-specific adenine glycosylase
MDPVRQVQASPAVDGATDDAVSYFRVRLLSWAERNLRSFPWRETSDPYAILMVEVMLRRTRADQVIPVYERFMARFPTPAALAGADVQAVSDTVRPLGLNWRVPAFQELARALSDGMGGHVPESRSALLGLSGVGDYVAAAVRIFAFNVPDTLVDTNTVRVAARYLGFSYGAESRRNSTVRAAVGRLHDHTQPRRFGRALLDFAALVCRAPTPRCDMCPMSSRCAYVSQNNAPSEVPW